MVLTYTLPIDTNKTSRTLNILNHKNFCVKTKVDIKACIAIVINFIFRHFFKKCWKFEVIYSSKPATVSIFKIMFCLNDTNIL